MCNFVMKRLVSHIDCLHNTHFLFQTRFSTIVSKKNKNSVDSARKWLFQQIISLGKTFFVETSPKAYGSRLILMREFFFCCCRCKSCSNWRNLTLKRHWKMDSLTICLQKKSIKKYRKLQQRRANNSTTLQTFKTH